MKRIIIFAAVVLLHITFLLLQVHGDAIVHGKPADIGEFPFMAALGWVNNITNKVDYLCGGTLISAKFILTAAHCLFFQSNLPGVIEVGGNRLLSEYNENHTVEAYFVHPDYSSSQAYNDIALIKIKGISSKRPAQLQNIELTASNIVRAIGYGTTQFAGMRTNKLQKVDLTIVPEKMCRPFFDRQRKFKSGISSTHICARDIIRFGDTCQGDSGGPLLLKNRFVVGITSVGLACSGDPPGVYTRVSSYIDWIEKLQKENWKSALSA